MISALCENSIIRRSANVANTRWHANAVNAVRKNFVGFSVAQRWHNHYLFTGLKKKSQLNHRLNGKKMDVTPLTTQLAGVATWGKRSVNCSESITRRISLIFRSKICGYIHFVIIKLCQFGLLNIASGRHWIDHSQAQFMIWTNHV